MMEITNRIVYLLRRHISHELNIQEQTELQTWADRHPGFRRLLDEVSDEQSLRSALRAFDTVYGVDPAASIRRMKRRIAEAIPMDIDEPAAQPRIRRLQKWMPYAAAIMIAAASFTVYFLDRGQERTDAGPAAEEILPGGNRATLTLADGRTIDLSETRTGIVVAGGNITYSDGDTVLMTPSETLVLTTPKGGTYQITLSDGSRVWLNAGSTLKYPSNFDDHERTVHLEGEAYFSITQSRKGADAQNIPFKVLTAGQEVDVLGTGFNISAYPDQSETKTTLVTGRVRVAPATGHRSAVILHPGQQAITRGADTEVITVDTDIYTAWKHGFFYFDRLPTKDAIAQLARWYDLEVAYEGKLQDDNMFAYIERNKPLGAVLKSLEKSGLTFRVTRSGERNRLIVLGEQ